MSSWDRQATVSRYRALFASAEDQDALTEELGTPTKLAIKLARNYMPTSAYERDPAEIAEPEAQAPEQFQMDLGTEPEAPEPAVKTERRVSWGAVAAYLVPAVVIGLPVAVVLLCVGIPFLAAGAALIAEAAKTAMTVIAALALVSDVLVTLGAALVLCGLGLLLCWLGIWISAELGWLWVGKVVVALGRRLCVKEVAL